MLTKSRFFAFAALILSCYALPSINATAVNVSNICKLTNTNELIASPGSCADYYTCQNDVAVLSTCANGFAFDKNSQQCLPASTVNCVTAGSTPCAGQAVGTWAAVPGSCQGFYYCSANGPVLGSCPNGDNFSPASQSCVFASQYPCADATTGTGDSTDNSGEDVGINLCAYMPEGIFFGSASSCNAWNKCTNGIMTTGFCPSGYNFNPAMGNCDYIKNVVCTQVTNDPNLSNSPSVGSPCTTQGALTPATQCNSYYICNGAQNVLYTCQSGYYYDTVSKTCVPRMQARNDCDRCQGTTSSFVNSYSTVNCDGYLICQNGVSTGSGACTNGFFDEVSGACIEQTTTVTDGVSKTTPGQPSYGCCNPQVYAQSSP